jgi:glutathione peroxidase-family protein
LYFYLANEQNLNFGDFALCYVSKVLMLVTVAMEQNCLTLQYKALSTLVSGWQLIKE